MSDPSPYAQLAAAMATDWRLKARPEQLAPSGDWTIWAILAGRGWGKTRVGAEWVLQQAKTPGRRIALVGATASDVRAVMVEGDSGILNCSPASNRPIYEPSRRQLTWSNGTIALCYSADEPDRLRGPQHHYAWCDELAAYSDPDTWDQVQLGLRLGDHPKILVSTTPRPTKTIKDLVSREAKDGIYSKDKDVFLTRGKTLDNKNNLAPTFMKTVLAKYEGTRLGRQELEAELLYDVPGALWSLDLLDRCRIQEAPENLRRIVVAIDPATTSGENSDETGILVCGIDKNRHGYVLEDLSGKYQPAEWAAEAIKAYKKWHADRIVAEINQGGMMVENTLRVVNASIPYKGVHASRGKVTRAEPVSALFEQGKVSLVGRFPKLEAQMVEFTADFSKAKSGYSPDRVDALVYALTELAVGPQVSPARNIAFHFMGR